MSTSCRANLLVIQHGLAEVLPLARGCPIVPGWKSTGQKNGLNSGNCDLLWSLKIGISWKQIGLCNLSGWIQLNWAKFNLTKIDKFAMFCHGDLKNPSSRVSKFPSSRTRLSQFVMHVTKALHHPITPHCVHPARWRACATFPPTSAICSTSTVTRQPPQFIFRAVDQLMERSSYDTLDIVL